MIKKTFQKLIIFSSISLVFIGWAGFASADCYTSVYTPCVENESDLQLEEWSAWDRVSNCHCAGSDLVFDNVCSGEGEFHTYDFDRVYGYPPPPIVYLPIVYHIKGTVLNRSRCPLCLGKGGPVDWFMDEQECLEAGWGCDASYPLQITPGRKSPYPYQCFWRDPLTTDDIPGCTAMKDYGEKEEGGVLHIYHTYQPCKPPPPLPTCQEKCQIDHQRDGKCLSAPDPVSGFPKALKQEGQFRDCDTGQSCYCQNHKPVVENISLYVDPEYKDKFEDYDDGKITEYDPIICQVTIYDADVEEQAKGKIGAEVLVRIEKGERKFFWFRPASCEFDEATKRHKCRRTFSPEDIDVPEDMGNMRGKKIKCEVRPNDAYQFGEWAISKEEYIVAQFNYYFIHLTALPRVTNYKEQYKLFTELSAVDDTLEDAGKALFVKKERCSIDRRDFDVLGLEMIFGRTLEELFILGGSEVVLPKIDQCMRSIGLVWNSESEKDRVSGLSGITEGFTATGEDTALIGDWLRTLAHELGHTYGLCDEYAYFMLGQGYWMQRVLRGCDNDYPVCCIDNPENELYKTLDQEIDSKWRDGLTFNQWMGKNQGSLTDGDLFGLRQNCPCSKVRGMCLYPSQITDENMLKEQYPILSDDEYVVLRYDLVINLYCPIEKKWLNMMPAACYIKKERIIGNGNHCYDPFESWGSLPGNCAGMPLKRSGNLFVEDATDLGLPYRSIMGHLFQPAEIFRYPSKAKYPLNPK